MENLTGDGDYTAISFPRYNSDNVKKQSKKLSEIREHLLLKWKLM
jgi:hypothetical protein